MTERDGGPAFPTYYHPTEGFDRGGMTLRDWFAGQAPGLDKSASVGMAEALVGPAPERFDLSDPESALAWIKWWARADANARYVQADAMLAAREDTP
ncbi:hypothetical protein P6F26_16950 [Roseibacterium sp. SDUM158017]|uniref:hypothetical protein n=1 Tax=Roseicyclus salinarum TaxID=3036773 RepID=UPI002414FCAF|nr:hypothetical protein [Roseibacterium sp. SDUM158017]MDG4650139.1 hypothetical protein [Roseibacterium sp. SDUM158017]